MHKFNYGNSRVKDTINKIQKVIRVGAGKIMKVTRFNCSFCCKMFRSRHDLKIHQLTHCVPAPETKEIGQRRSLGVQTMNLGQQTPTLGMGL